MSVEVEDSTFVANDATIDHGGAIFVGNGTLDVNRSTFSGNVANGDGGALAITDSTATVTSATIYQNRADADGVGGGNGGGVALDEGVLQLRNSIVARNEDLSPALVHPDISQPLGNGSKVITKGFNLVGSHASVQKLFPEAADPDRPNVNGDLVGSADKPLDPQLADLADNVGPTRTHHPLPGSPVIDAGNVHAEVADQRGFQNRDTRLRAVDDLAPPDFSANKGDMGALEVGAETPLRDGVGPRRTRLLHLLGDESHLRPDDGFFYELRGRDEPSRSGGRIVSAIVLTGGPRAPVVAEPVPREKGRDGADVSRR